MWLCLCGSLVSRPRPVGSSNQVRVRCGRRAPSATTLISGKLRCGPCPTQATPTGFMSHSPMMRTCRARSAFFSWPARRSQTCGLQAASGASATLESPAGPAVTVRLLTGSCRATRIEVESKVAFKPTIASSPAGPNQEFRQQPADGVDTVSNAADLRYVPGARFFPLIIRLEAAAATAHGS